MAARKTPRDRYGPKARAFFLDGHPDKVQDAQNAARYKATMVTQPRIRP